MYEVNKKIDPDFIFTNDGDSLTFPHLIHRAEENSNTSYPWKRTNAIERQCTHHTIIAN
jgi:DNA polymerase elongation subunit (family B)